MAPTSSLILYAEDAAAEGPSSTRSLRQFRVLKIASDREARGRPREREKHILRCHVISRLDVILWSFTLTPVLSVGCLFRLVQLEHASYHETMQSLDHLTTMELIR